MADGNTEFLDDLLHNPEFIASPDFDRIASIIVISRHWAKADAHVMRDFARVFYSLLTETAIAHGFADGNYDDYLAAADDELAEALWQILTGLLDDEVGQRWEAAVPPERYADYVQRARAARLIAPNGVASIRARIDMLLALNTN